MRPLALALVHFPIVGRDGQLITTTITNLDLHDIARSARTYGVEAFYVVHPVAAQRTLAARIKAHWTEGGSGARRMPDRPAALDLIEVVPTLDDALAALGARFPERGAPELWTTAAQARDVVVPYAEARRRLADDDGAPALLVFGTGWGLAPAVLDRASARLEPIVGRGDWNHLSVRAACAISLDRLLGALRCKLTGPARGVRASVATVSIRALGSTGLVR